MSGTQNDNRRTRLLLIALGVVALIFITAAITSNLNIWRLNDAFDAQQASEGTAPAGQ